MTYQEVVNKMMDNFELLAINNFGDGLYSFGREDEKLWNKQIYYRHSKTNTLFKLFLAGVNYGILLQATKGGLR